ncbi:MAG: tetratricopeptide repeat protein [bacterium]
MKRLFFLILAAVMAITASTGPAYALGTAAKGPRRNLLLITIDTLRADHLGCYGYRDANTPAIDRLSSKGVLFTRAFTPVPITLPSHVTILTGLYPLQHGVRNNGNYLLDPEVLTMAEVMKDHGLHTGACIGAFVLDSLFGLDQGFDFYEDSLPKEGAAAILLENERRGEEVTRAGLDWLSALREGPFFLWLHYFDPHAVYLPPSPFREQYKGHLYDGEIAYTDHCIGDLFLGMERLGLMDKTAVILTSDHGEGLGEHGEPTHAIFVYDTTMHVPLIIHDPLGTIPAGRIDEMVSTLDILPTVLDLFGIPLKGASTKTLPGKSLLPLMTGNGHSFDREILLESLYPEENFGWSRIEGIRTPEWKFVSAPRPEVYNLAHDPKEGTNLYPQDAGPWRERLEALKTALGPGRSAQVNLDDQVRKRMESLGYVWSGAGETEGRPDPKDMIALLEGIDRGVSYIYLGLYDRARREFQTILSVNPDNASALFYLASIEEKSGNLDEAERTFRRLLAVSPNYLDVHNHLGVIYHKKGDPDKALEEFELALAQAEYAEVYYNLSVVHRQKGDLDKSIHAAQRSLALDPRYVDALNQLGQLSLDRKNYDEAAGFLRKAIELDPNHLQAHNNLGVLFHRLGRGDDALREFEKSLSIDPNSAEAHNNRGSIFMEKGLYNQAEEEFSAAVRIKPDYIEAIINLGTVHLHRAEYAAAANAYTKAVEMAPGHQGAWTHRGILYLAQGDYNAAQRALETAITKGPASADLYFYLGQASSGLNRPHEALALWRHAVELDPRHTQAFLKLGQALFDRGLLREAIAAWERAYTIDPADPVPLLNMATARFQDADYAQAISLWERALALDPTLEEPYLHIGTAYLRQNNIDKAIAVWETLLAARPDHVEALINLGTANYERKDYDAAISIWRRAEELDYENPKVHFNLGLALFALQDYRGAVDHLREALRIEPSNQDVLVLLQEAKRLCPAPCN